jgi:hypothetical protein
MTDIDEWVEAFDDFVVAGRSSNSDELSGSITFLAPDLQEELATVLLDKIGFLSLKLPNLETDKNQNLQFTVELYVEDIFFEYLGNFGGGSFGTSVATPTPTPAATPSATPTAIPSPTPEPVVYETLPVTATPATPFPTATPTPAPSPPPILPTTTPTPSPTAVPIVLGNKPPKVSIRSTVEDVVGGSVVLEYVLYDFTGDRTSIKVEFSVDGGKGFNSASPFSLSDVTSKLETSASGISHRFSWNTGLDLGVKPFDSVIVRITPSDSSVGRSDQIGPFAYNPLRDTVAKECGIRDGQWLLDSKNWDELNKALLVCENRLVVSLQDGLVAVDKTARSTRTLSATLNEIGGAQKLVSAYGGVVLTLQQQAADAYTGTVSEDQFSATLTTLNDLAVELDKSLSTLGEDSQLINLKLQDTLQQQQRTLQTLSNVLQMSHDTLKSIINNFK